MARFILIDGTNIDAVMAALDSYAQDRFDDDAHVLSDDDGIGNLWDEIGHLYPCESEYSF